jgi:HSP20 family molecular chaperone IbpA
VDEVDDFIFRLGRRLMNMAGVELSYANEPYVEFTEGDDMVQLTAELPGVKPEGVKVRVFDGAIRLTIADNGLVVYSEDFECAGIARKHANISLRNGILQVSVPRAKSIF